MLYGVLDVIFFKMTIYCDYKFGDLAIDVF